MADRTNSELKRQFYAIASPKSIKIENEPELVFTEKQEVLETLKKFKGAARFKIFDKFEDAVEYSKKGLEEEEDVNDKKTASDAERASSGGFRAPDPPQLSKLRKMIENSSISEVKEMILLNPRFLISCGDTPVILMEGPRYNAFHCACRTNQFEVLKFIVHTIKDPSFMKKLYPVDDEITTNNRISQLLDKYLNTPDKAANDTPLHFASKFGAKDCVKILLSEKCDVDVVNKLGKRPFQVICERKGDSETRYYIKSLFESRYYVPVFRSADGVNIGSPCTEVPEDETVKALAGPMPPIVANELYRNLRSPATRANHAELSIRLSDCHKGVERIARSICKAANVSWREYWPFLNSNIDLCSQEGLMKLEKHLESVEKRLSTKSEQLSNNLEYFCKKLEKLSFSQENESLEIPNSASPEVYVTAPTSPQALTDFFVEGETLSKWDVNAALALTDVEIDRVKYPYVSSWLQRVLRNYTGCTSPTLSLTPSVNSNNYNTPRKTGASNIENLKKNIFNDSK